MASDRSRTGCFTCRARKKKCPESWNPSGECLRCVGNNLHCERERPLRPKGANPKHSRTSLSAADHDPTPARLKTHSKYPLRQESMEAEDESGGGDGMEGGGGGLVAGGVAMGSVPASAAHLLHQAGGEVRGQSPVHHLGWPPYSPAPALPPHVSPTRPLSQTPLAPACASAPAPAPASVPAPASTGTELSPFAAAHQPIPPSTSPTGHWNDYLLDFFEPRAEPSADRPHHPVADLSTWFNLDMLVPFDDPPDLRTPPNLNDAAATALDPTSLNSVDPSAPPQELPSDIIAIYSSLNDDLLRSLPRPAAELLSRQWNSLASSTELGRAAAMALCMLQYLRLPENRNHEAQARILAQSNTYFERAVTHLADGQIPLEAQLNAVIDMHYHQLDVAGAGPAYAMLLIGEVFVTQAMGDKPILDLAKAAGFQSSSIRLFAYIDTFRTLCLGGRRTVVTYHGLNALFADGPEVDESTETEAFRLNELHRLPVVFLVCFAETSNLAVDAAGLGREEVLGRAGRIERAILGWKPSSPQGPLKDSVAYINNLATQEMWRHAALIHLYQAAFRLGCLSQKIQHARNQIIQLGARVASSSSSANTPADRQFTAVLSTRACPWFLAATVATTDADRQACLQGLRDCGLSRVLKDNCKAAEALWRRMDGEGREEDWRAVLREEGLLVAFL